MIQSECLQEVLDGGLEHVDLNRFRVVGIQFREGDTLLGNGLEWYGSSLGRIEIPCWVMV